MKRISNPKALGLHEIIEDPSSDKIYMVIPYCEDGQILEFNSEKEEFTYNESLLDEERKPKMSEILKIAKELMEGLYLLHEHDNVAHRDIKPDNILLSSKKPFIGDFGKSFELSLSSENDYTTSIEGTPAYLPPECCTEESSEYSMKRADVWALGITLYNLVHLKMPFSLKGSQFELMNSIRKCEPNFSQDVEVPNTLLRIIKSMLAINPQDRPMMKDVIISKDFEEFNEEIFNLKDDTDSCQLIIDQNINMNIEGPLVDSSPLSSLMDCFEENFHCFSSSNNI